MARTKQPPYRQDSPAVAARLFAANYRAAQSNQQRKVLCQEYDAAVIWSQTAPFDRQLIPRDHLSLSPSPASSVIDEDFSDDSLERDSSGNESLLVQHCQQQPSSSSTTTPISQGKSALDLAAQKRADANRKSAASMARLRAARKQDATKHLLYREQHNEHNAKYRAAHRADIRRKQEQRRYSYVLFSSRLSLLINSVSVNPDALPRAAKIKHPKDYSQTERNIHSMNNLSKRHHRRQLTKSEGSEGGDQ